MERTLETERIIRSRARQFAIRPVGVRCNGTGTPPNVTGGVGQVF